jgi:hypothetical protein
MVVLLRWAGCGMLQYDLSNWYILLIFFGSMVVMPCDLWSRFLVTDVGDMNGSMRTRPRMQ